MVAYSEQTQYASASVSYLCRFYGAITSAVTGNFDYESERVASSTSFDVGVSFMSGHAKDRLHWCMAFTDYTFLHCFCTWTHFPVPSCVFESIWWPIQGRHCLSVGQLINDYLPVRMRGLLL